MRTTVDLPGALFRRMKAAATMRGMSIKDFLMTAVESEISKSEASDNYSVQLPLIRSKRPGMLDLTNAEIEDLLD